MYSWIPILFNGHHSVGTNGTSPLILLFILMPSLAQLCPVGAPSLWFYILLIWPVMPWALHCFWHKMFQAHLIFSPPQSWNQPFLQEVLATVSKEWYFDSSAKYGYRYWEISTPSQRTELRIYAWSFIHTHTIGIKWI